MNVELQKCLSACREEVFVYFDFCLFVCLCVCVWARSLWCILTLCPTVTFANLPEREHTERHTYLHSVVLTDVYVVDVLFKHVL